jgi:hypothetical protein
MAADISSIRKVISRAIQEAYITYPRRNDGTTWDQKHVSNEECELFTNAVLVALKNNKLEIVEKK